MIITKEMIISGFISKIISDIVDIPENPIKDAIRNADKKRRDKNQSIETRIYQVTIDAIKEFTKREYKGQDVLYDAAESILKGFIRNKDDKVEAIRAGLKMLGLQVASETCKEFLKTLCHVICMDENDILYKEIILIQGGQTFETVREGFDVSNRNDEKTHEKLDYVIEGIDKINEKINRTENGEAKHYEIPIKNRAGEYADKWEKNVFLNNFNKRDENAGINIKLSEIYLINQLPHYTWKTGLERRYDLEDLLTEYIIDNIAKKMLLILGQAGIGKSTLITWIMANLGVKNEQFLVYQFASDLKNIDWQGDNILEDIFKVIGCSYRELEGKTLILDGFDEIHINGDRERILYKLSQELKKKNYLKRFSLIITCRENYVDQSNLVNSDYITLQSWDEGQIRSFCEIYEEVITRKNSEPRVNNNSEIKINKIIEKKDIMGIPLILYMVLALNVDVEISSSIVDIYDQIFSLKRGGIYDKNYDTEHRINEPEIKKHIHRISQQMAFWMFENNADEATISQEKFEEICDNEMRESGKKGEGIQRDTLIGNFFVLKHCEGKGTDEIQFVHRSIYEYFVVVYFFESLRNLKCEDEIAGKLGELLKDGQLSEQILEFIKYKFDSMKGYSLSDITKKVFNIMLQNGMTYYTEEKYKNIFIHEINIFINMLKIVCLWNLTLGEIDDKLIIYLQCNRESGLNLKGIRLSDKNCDRKRIDLRGAYLNKAILIGADLSGGDLRRVHLNGANLCKANLSNADLGATDLIGVDLNGANLWQASLSGTDLRYACLRGADLRGADLNGANLSRADLCGANLKEANLGGTYLNMTLFDESQVNMLCGKYDLSLCDILLNETNERIGYQEYCITRQNN